MNKFLAKFKIELNEFGYRTVLTPKTMTTRRRGKPPPGAGVNLCLEKVIQFIRIVGYRLPQSPSLLFPFPPSFSFLFLPLFSSPLGIPYFSHLWVFPSNFSPLDSRLSPFPSLFPSKSILLFLPPFGLPPSVSMPARAAVSPAATVGWRGGSRD